MVYSFPSQYLPKFPQEKRHLRGCAGTFFPKKSPLRPFDEPTWIYHVFIDQGNQLTYQDLLSQRKGSKPGEANFFLQSFLMGLVDGWVGLFSKKRLPKPPETLAKVAFLGSKRRSCWGKTRRKKCRRRSW